MPAQEVPLFRARSSLVLVPVSVLDKHGKPVGGLTMKDFVLLVDGKPVTISTFDAVVEGGTNAPASPARVLPKNLFVNVPSTVGRSNNFVVLLIDYLNTLQAQRMVLRAQALKFFAEQLRANEQIAVYGLTYSLVLIQPFTGNPAQLTEVARNLLRQKGVPRDAPAPLPLPLDSGHQGSSGGDIEAFLLQSARRDYNLNQLDRAARTLQAFRELAAAFAGVPGKKTVIWLTGDASPLNPTLLYQYRRDDPSLATIQTPDWDIAKTYEALNGAGMSLFPVDVRGVFNSGLQDSAQGETHTEFRQSLGESQPKDESLYSNMTDFRQGEAGNAILAMQGAAAETGGVVLEGKNDLGELLDRAGGYWRNYYVLGFAPGEPADAHKAVYHSLGVKVKDGAVHVLARRGFITRPDKLIASQAETQRDIREAANSPVDLTSLPLELKLSGSSEAGSGSDIPFTLVIGGDALSPAQDAKGLHYDLTVVRLLRSQHGETVDSAGEVLTSVATPAEAETLRNAGFSYHGAFHCPSAGPFSARVIVRDNHTGRVGTITFELPHQ